MKNRVRAVAVLFISATALLLAGGAPHISRR